MPVDSTDKSDHPSTKHLSHDSLRPKPSFHFSLPHAPGLTSTATVGQKEKKSLSQKDAACRYPMSDIRYPISDIRHPISDIRRDPYHGKCTPMTRAAIKVAHFGRIFLCFAWYGGGFLLSANSPECHFLVLKHMKYKCTYLVYIGHSIFRRFFF